MTQEDDNKRALQEAATIQQDTLDALYRIQIQALETEMVGVETLAELQLHREQMDRILQDGDRLRDQLNTTKKLQNRLGRWAWRRTDRAARRELAVAKSIQKKKEDGKKKRDSRIAAAAAPSTTDESSTSPSTLKSSSLKKKRKRRKNKKQVDDEPQGNNKGLLYGNDAAALDDSYGSDLQGLADTDAVIDEEMDNLNSQLDTLLRLSKAVDSEAKRQDCALGEITKQMEDANDKQAVANSRARRFLTGRKRSECDKKFTLFGAF